MNQSDNKCLQCAHYTPTQIFELCGHASSAYRVGDHDDLHTVSHMRGKACGAGAKLFQAIGKAT